MVISPLSIQIVGVELMLFYRSSLAFTVAYVVRNIHLCKKNKKHVHTRFWFITLTCQMQPKHTDSASQNGIEIPGKVMVVPFFHPGWISMSNTCAMNTNRHWAWWIEVTLLDLFCLCMGLCHWVYHPPCNFHFLHAPADGFAIRVLLTEHAFPTLNIVGPKCRAVSLWPLFVDFCRYFADSFPSLFCFLPRPCSPCPPCLPCPHVWWVHRDQHHSSSGYSMHYSMALW